MSKIKKGDNVKMLNGKDKGKTGKVTKILAKENRAVVEGLNVVKRAMRARQQGKTGQIIERERPVSISSIALVCKSCGKPTRIGYKVDGKSRVRICKKCKNEV